MTTKSLEPSVAERAFDCPHCGAYTSQTWYSLHAKPLDSEQRTPTIARAEHRQNIEKLAEPDQKEHWLKEHAKRMTGLAYLVLLEHGTHARYDAINLAVSECYVCHEFGVWVYDRLVFPQAKLGAEPNTDLPEDIKIDFEEARSIVEASPRGAAALLRLAIQKLCKELGGTGKKIDADIALLVDKGLNPMVQKSLDIVRVVGNESVHPGKLDMRDDRETARHLFGLVNAIADQMITHPKTVDDLYSKLPEDKRKGIEQRDKNAGNKP